MYQSAKAFLNQQDELVCRALYIEFLKGIQRDPDCLISIFGFGRSSNVFVSWQLDLKLVDGGDTSIQGRSVVDGERSIFLPTQIFFVIYKSLVRHLLYDLTLCDL